MHCKPKSEFRMKNLVSEIRSKTLSKEDEVLLKLFEMFNAKTFVENMRDLYYLEGQKYYKDWLEDEMNSRMFWEEIADAAEKTEWDGGYKLTPEDKEALGDACHGLAGRELFAFIVTWFYQYGFIRTDITVWNCRVFRYMDSYLMTKKNIIVGIFSRYEEIRYIEDIRIEVVGYLKQIIPSHALMVLRKQINTDERYFETGIKKEESLSEDKKDLLDLAHKELREHAEEIYALIFR